MVEVDGNDVDLSKHSVKSIGHEHSDRISDDAILRIIYHEENRIHDVFRKAKMLAQHRGRETITEDDVRLVYKMRDEI